MSPPPTGRPKWKRNHHQEERLFSTYTGGETVTDWGCSPLQQEKNKVFILQLGCLTLEVPGHPGSLAHALKETNCPGFKHSSLTRPIGPLSSNQMQSVLSGRVQKANVESSKHILTHRAETPQDTQYALALNHDTILTTGYCQLLPQTLHFLCPWWHRSPLQVRSTLGLKPHTYYALCTTEV